eukprot:scaffold475_cov279-Pinguiococcus_pyrenoidosus.AAC.14
MLSGQQAVDEVVDQIWSASVAFPTGRDVEEAHKSGAVDATRDTVKKLKALQRDSVGLLIVASLAKLDVLNQAAQNGNASAVVSRRV